VRESGYERKVENGGEKKRSTRWLGRFLYKNTLFTKRTQLKNSEAFRHE